MIPRAADKGSRGMTEMAIQISLNMWGAGPGQLGLFTDRVSAIVAGITTVHDTGMIKRCWNEAAGIMTYTTIFIRLNMIGSFSSGKYAIVTGATVIHNPGVIKRCWQEACG